MPRREAKTPTNETIRQITMSKINKLVPAEIDQQSRFADAALNDAAESQAPWEQIENGRYMPRRIRGSFRGGVLG